MALVPLKQEITVHPAGTSDGWGGVTEGTPFTLNARVVEKTEVTEKVEDGQTDTKTAVAKLEITLDKLADVGYDDTIEYTNELGVTVKRQPLSIEVKRMLSGKPVLTVVQV